MSRHLQSQHGITSQTHKSGFSQQSQTQLGGYVGFQPGGGTPFHYTHQNMVNHMADFVIDDEQPFMFAESPNYERLNRGAFQPGYKAVNRQTLQRRAFKKYFKQRDELISYFAKYKGRVSLTSDGWTAKPSNDQYICVTAHWIDTDWVLQKRIITFDDMDERHTGQNISNRIEETCKEFNLVGKVFSISFDNATANTKAIEYVVKNWPGLLLNGKLVHVRCCAHIINLSAQEGITFLAPLLQPIKQCVKWIKNTPSIRRRYKTLCREHKLPFVDWSNDTPTRWNSTYYLLKKALKYKIVISELYNSEHDYPGAVQIDDSMWVIANNIAILLKAYDDATHCFSLVYEPNVHLVIFNCVNIVKSFKQAESDEMGLTHVVLQMKAKWLNYFTDFPQIYGIACILDPSLKRMGLSNLLDYYYDMLGIQYDYEGYVESCVDVLRQLCVVYNGQSSSSSSGPSMPKERRFDADWNSIIFRRRQSSASSTVTKDLDDYLSYGVDSVDKDFNILNWWCSHSSQFPLLSQIARECLVVPASTVASESAFSAGGRVLDEKRSSLASDTIKMCVCKKDWDMAAIRLQGCESPPNDPDDDPLLIIEREDLTESDA